MVKLALARHSQWLVTIFKIVAFLEFILLKSPDFFIHECLSVMMFQDGTSDQPGIVPRALEELFRQAALDNSSSVSFSMSMLEVYMGSVRDLLAPKPVFKAYEAAIRW